MSTSQSAMQTMKISDVRKQLNRLANQVYRGETRILVEKCGVPVVGIVSVQDLRRLERLDGERAERFQILEEFGETFEDIPAEKLEREVARAIAEVRAKRFNAINEFGAGFTDQSLEEIERETTHAIAQVRSEQYQETAGTG